MFSFLKRKKRRKKLTNDKVWMSHSEKVRGFSNDLQVAVNANEQVFICYFFETSLNWINQILNDANTIAKELEQADNTTQIVLVNIYELLTRSSLKALFKKQIEKSTAHCFMFSNRYPISSKEDEVLELLVEHEKTLPCFYVSLEDELMQHFGGDRVVKLMQRMGIAPDEFVEHQLISDAIRNAQAKVEKRNHGKDGRAISQKEWFIYYSN